MKPLIVVISLLLLLPALAQQPPKMASITAPNVRTVGSVAVALFSGRNVPMKLVQNNGTNALLYSIGGVPTTSSYHGVIAGGVAERDGLGTSVDFSTISAAVPIYVIATSGSTEISVVEASP